MIEVKARSSNQAREPDMKRSWCDYWRPTSADEAEAALAHFRIAVLAPNRSDINVPSSLSRKSSIKLTLRANDPQCMELMANFQGIIFL
jgi:hypothetical protein